MRRLAVIVCLGFGCTSSTIDLEDGGSGAATQDDDGSVDGTGTGTPGSADGTAGSADATAGDDDGLDDDGPVVTTSAPDTGPPPPIGFPDGRYLLVLDTSLEPGLPFQWEVNAMQAANTFEGQSLSLDAFSQTTPRELIGGVWAAQATLEEDLLFVTVPPLQILGEANPVTGEELITSELFFDGYGLGDGSYCGTVEGTLNGPIPTPLTGSTFTLIPVPAGEAWPLEFPLECPV